MKFGGLGGGGGGSEKLSKQASKQADRHTYRHYSDQISRSALRDGATKNQKQKKKNNVQLKSSKYDHYDLENKYLINLMIIVIIVRNCYHSR